MIFVGRSGADHDEPSQQRAGWPQNPLGRRDDVVGLGEAALADPAAGQIARARIDELHASRCQHRQVATHGVVLQHVRVHGRSHQDRRARRQIQRTEKVVCDAMRELADDVGRGRRDQQQLGIGRERDVLDVGIGAACVLIGDDRPAG